jgi:hypothetical protein
VSGDVIYPHRPDLYNQKFYICPKCGKYVGTHKGTIRPLGCIPTNELKVERQKIHTKMDILWKTKQISRNKLYKLISQKLGYNYHTGETRTVQECLKVLDIIDEIRKEIKAGV